MFKTGDLVRHRTKDDWGLGKVVTLTADGKVVICSSVGRAN